MSNIKQVMSMKIKEDIYHLSHSASTDKSCQVNYSSLQKEALIPDIVSIKCIKTHCHQVVYGYT